MTCSEHMQCIFLAILKPEFGSFSHVASHHTNYMGLFARQIFCFPTHLPPFILCITSSISLTAAFITSFLRLAPGPAPCNCRHGQPSPQQVPWSSLRSCKERKESCILFSSSPRWGRCCWPSSPYPFSLGQIQYQDHIFLQAKHQDQEIARSSWPITLFPCFLLLAIAEAIFDRRTLDMAIVYHSCSSLAAFDMGAVLGHLLMQSWKLL